MSLAFDMTRCHDSECPSRQTCARYRERNNVGPRTPQVDTFRESDTEDCCDKFIKFKRTRTTNVRGGE